MRQKNKRLFKWNVRPYACEECSFSAAQKKNLERHQERHQIRLAHRCPVCSYSSKSAGRLTFHTRFCHPDDEGKPGNVKRAAVIPNRPFHFLGKGGLVSKWSNWRSLGSSRRPSHNCTHCSFRTAHPQLLEAHEPRHFLKSTFKCPFCSYSVSRTSTLRMHMKRDHRYALTAKKRIQVDDDQLPRHFCHFCDYWNYSELSLRSHLKMHVRGAEAFQCPQCSYSSKRQGVVRRHVEKDHVKKRKDREVRTLQERVEVMKRKVWLEAQEVQIIAAKIHCVQRKLEDLQVKEEEAKNVARNYRHQMSGVKVPTPAMRKVLDQAEDDVLLAGKKLKDLREELESLVEDERIAVESRIGADQVLQILQRELEEKKKK